MKNPKVLPCPCGKTPNKLCLTDAGQGMKWAWASCDICGEWSIEFRTRYHPLDSKECMDLAIADWNDAPRKPE